MSATDGGTWDTKSGSGTVKGDCSTDRSDGGRLRRSRRGSLLGVATVVRDDLNVVESLSGNGPKVSISNAIAERAGDDEGELCAICGSLTRGDSLFRATTVARGDSSATELSAKNELTVAKLSATDGRDVDQLGQGATGVSFNSL